MDTVLAGARPVVLVAEDDEGMRELYREVLAKNGLTVVETANGSDVVDLARQHAPKLILLDVRLPGMTGDDVLRALKSDDILRAIPVIAATGLCGRDVESWKAIGFADVLFKPIRLNDLIEAVQRYID